MTVARIRRTQALPSGFRLASWSVEWAAGDGRIEPDAAADEEEHGDDTSPAPPALGSIPSTLAH